MIIKQYCRASEARIAYLIADEATRIAAVVDPVGGFQEYLEDARLQKLKINHVFLTRGNFAFIHGTSGLQARTGATIYLGARSRESFGFLPVRGGDAFEFGEVRVVVVETPGVAPESISLLLYDLTQDDRTPAAVLTGETLLIGDVGRPGSPKLAGELYDSLQTKLLALPDETLVYPGRGSSCPHAREHSRDATTTIGEQRRSNPLMGFRGCEEFIRYVMSRMKSRGSSAVEAHDEV